MFMKAEEGKTDTKLNTIIGSGSLVEGDVIVEGGIRVDGSIVGNRVVAKGPLTVGRDGSIKAPSIEASSANIGGKIEGDIKVKETLRLETTARIYGNLVMKVLIIEEGARFTGNSNMSDGEKLSENSL
ncbi:polymer-forming cytoskeletal protein [bacterium]|nr:MAG: polymer-forming cytoskeletal protein [bacterium]